MQPDEEPMADVEIVASAAADELRFHLEPEVRVSFPGTGARYPARSLPRHIDTPVQPGRTYHRVFVTTRISSGLVDGRRRRVLPAATSPDDHRDVSLCCLGLDGLNLDELAGRSGRRAARRGVGSQRIPARLSDAHESPTPHPVGPGRSQQVLRRIRTQSEQGRAPPISLGTPRTRPARTSTPHRGGPGRPGPDRTGRGRTAQRRDPGRLRACGPRTR